MGIFDFLKKDEGKDLIINDNESLQRSVSDILLQIDGLIIKKASNYFEEDKYICSDDDFQKINKLLKEEGLDLEFITGKYVIKKVIKNTKGTTTNILRQFKYNNFKKQCD